MVDPSLLHSFKSHVMAILINIIMVPAFIHTFIIFFAEEIKTILVGLNAGRILLLYGIEELTSEK